MLYQGARMFAVLWAARLLSHEDMGLWNAAQAVALYATACQLGVFNGMNIEVPYQTGAGRPEKARHIEAVTLSALLGVSIGIAMITMLIAGTGWSPAGMSGPQVLLTGLLCIAQLAFLFVQMRMSARVQFGRVAILQLTAGLLTLSLTLWLVRAQGLSGLLLAFAAGWLVAAMIGWSRWEGTIAPHWDRIEGRRLIGIGSPILLAGFAQSLMTSVDRWVLLRAEGPATLGLYTLPIIVFGGLSVMPNVMSQQFYPRMARAFGETHRRAALRPMALQQMALSVAATGVVALVIAIGMRPVIALVLPRYLDGVTPALALLPGAVALGIAGVGGNVLVVLGARTRYLVMLCGGIALALALELFAQRAGHGVVGVATGASMAYVLTAIAVGVSAWRALRPGLDAASAAAGDSAV